ncbi:hypothetical protein ACXYMT_02650 [Salinimicrobium sp. CAU 1759]
MKNILIYYFSLVAPLVLLMLFWEQLDSTIALAFLAGYVFIYRTWLAQDYFKKVSSLKRKYGRCHLMAHE